MHRSGASDFLGRNLLHTTYNNRSDNDEGGSDSRSPRHHGRGGSGRFRGGIAQNAGSVEGRERRQYRSGGFGPEGPEGREGRGPGGFGPGGPLGGFGPDGPVGPVGYPFDGRGHRRGGPGGPRGRGFRARKGDIRLAILSILAETPSNGYVLMQTIAEKSGGTWRPSPGSVYPTLAQLVDENLIVSTGEGDGDRRSAYQLTAAGTAYMAEQSEAISTAWSAVTQDPEAADPLAISVRKLFGVIRQIDSDGTAEQRSQAGEQIDELRRSLYRKLGE